MKIAIISDVHSNIEALQACVARTQLAGVEQYVCLGDVIGYGPDSAATLDLVLALPNIVMVRGNHEEALLLLRTLDAAGILYARWSDWGGSWCKRGLIFSENPENQLFVNSELPVDLRKEGVYSSYTLYSIF